MNKKRPGLIGAVVALALIVIINPNNIISTDGNIIVSGIGEQDLSRTAGVEVPLIESSDTYFTENDDDKTPILLNDKISFQRLSKGKDIPLTIEVEGEEGYGATLALSNRLLQLFTDLETIKNNDYTYDETDRVIILSYEGYDRVFLNCDTGHFKFENEGMIYGHYQYDDKIFDNLFSRITLEASDDGMKYTGPKRLNILEEDSYDLDGDGAVEHIELYFDTAIHLAINEVSYIIDKYAYEETVRGYMSDEERTHYWYESSFNLRQIHSEISDKTWLLLEEQIEGVNRYGTSVNLMSFMYDGEGISLLDNFTYPEFTVLGYEDGIIEFGIEGIDQNVYAVCSEEKQTEMKLYLEFLAEGDMSFVGQKEWVFASNTLAHNFEEVGGKQHLFVARNIRGGASGITDLLFTVYDLSGDDVEVVAIDFLSYLRKNPNAIYDNFLRMLNL